MSRCIICSPDCVRDSVTDRTPTVFSGCPANALIISKFGVPGYDLFHVTDNSGALYSLTITVDPENFSPSQQVLTSTTVTYTATDLEGNFATCIVDIYVKGVEDTKLYNAWIVNDILLLGMGL